MYVVVAASFLGAAALDKIHVDTETSTFIDVHGNTRLLRGVNIVVKGPPWHPSREGFNANHSLVAEDFQMLRSIGVNVIRLGVMWVGLEPTKGNYNETYVGVLADIASEASEYGIYTLLDMHQDLFSEQFCGEGMPEWAVTPSSSCMHYPQPVRPLAFSSTDLDPATGLPTRQACNKLTGSEGLAFAGLYFAEDLSYAFQALYKNATLIQAWADAWTYVIHSFASANVSNALLGVELLNEPFSGDVLHSPKLLRPFIADRENLAPVYDTLAAQITQLSPETLIFFEGVTWGRWGTGFEQAPNNNPSKSALAFHFYKPLDNLPVYGARNQFEVNHNDQKNIQVGGMVTEMFSPACDPDYDDTMKQADTWLQSYAVWQYKSMCEETAASLAGVSQHAAFGACKTGGGCGFFDHAGSPLHTVFQQTARPYVPATAGELEWMKYELNSRKFEFKFNTGVSPSNITTIFVSSSLVYTAGFDVVLTPAAVGSWKIVSDTKVEVHSILDNTNITVKITPKSGI